MITIKMPPGETKQKKKRIGRTTDGRTGEVVKRAALPISGRPRSAARTAVESGVRGRSAARRECRRAQYDF